MPGPALTRRRQPEPDPDLRRWVRTGRFRPELPVQTPEGPLTPARATRAPVRCRSRRAEPQVPLLSARTPDRPPEPEQNHAGRDEAAGEVPEKADHRADPGRGVRRGGGGQDRRGQRGVPEAGQPIPGRPVLQGDVTGERPRARGLQVGHTCVCTRTVHS